MFGAQMGKGARTYPSARIWAPWNLNIGAYATVGPCTDLYSVGPIQIGESAIVSQYAFLCTASHDIHSPEFDLLIGPICIGCNAWIAAGAFVAPGVNVAEGAVVAARAVVVRDVPASVVVAGNPAIQVGTRDKLCRNVLAG